MKKIKLSKLKKGEYFKFDGKKKIYKYDGKVRMYDKYGKFKGWGFAYTPTDNVWGDHKQILKDPTVLIGFEY